MKRSITMTATAIAIVAGLFAPAANAGEGGLKLKSRTTSATTGVQLKARKSSTGVLTGAAVIRPDLIVTPRYGGNSGQPNTGYCGAWNGGNQSVVFYVRTTGTAMAPASQVYVGFTTGGFTQINVPALAPGGQVQRSYAIPAAAWGPSQYHGSASFLIAADHNDAMVEISEANNYGQSSCVGPAS